MIQSYIVSPLILGLGVPELLILFVVLLFVLIPVAIVVLVVVLVRRNGRQSPPRFDAQMPHDRR